MTVNVVLFFVIVIAVAVFMGVHGIDRPIRVDGVSPGCCPACAAAAGCPVGGRVFKQSLTATFLSIMGLVFFIAWVETDYEFSVPWVASSFGLLGIAVRGFYAGCCGAGSHRECCNGGCRSCTGASLVCCRLLHALVGWVSFACACLGSWFMPFMWSGGVEWCYLTCCIISNVFMFMAGCFAYTVPLKLREDPNRPSQQQHTGVIQAQFVRSASHGLMPEATVSYYTPPGSQRQVIGWQASREVAQVVAVVIDQPGAGWAAQAEVHPQLEEPSAKRVDDATKFGQGAPEHPPGSSGSSAVLSVSRGDC